VDLEPSHEEEEGGGGGGRRRSSSSRLHLQLSSIYQKRPRQLQGKCGMQEEEEEESVY